MSNVLFINLVSLKMHGKIALEFWTKILIKSYVIQNYKLWSLLFTFKVQKVNYTTF